MTKQYYHTPTQQPVPAYYRSAAWKKLRAAVLARDGRICRYCGRIGSQADHVIPRKRGGPDALSNLVACCASCNRVAGGRLFASFEEKQRWILGTRGISRHEPVFTVTHKRLHPDDQKTVVNAKKRRKCRKTR